MGRQCLRGKGFLSYHFFRYPAQKYGARGHANIYVDGTLNMTTPGGNLNFDNGTGADNHYWHIGLDGMINLSNTTTITKNAKTWNVEVVVASAMEGLAVTNREMVDDALITRYFMSTGADLGASLDSLRIWKQTGDDAYEALTRVDSAGQLGRVISCLFPTVLACPCSTRGRV